MLFGSKKAKIPNSGVTPPATKAAAATATPAPPPTVRVKAGTSATAAPAGVPVAASAPSPEMKAKIADVRNRIHAAVGQVVLALSVVPRYRHQTLGDLQALVLEPLLRDRVAIATEKTSDAGGSTGPDAKSTSEGPTQNGALAGIAFWATVSDAVDAKIREQIKAGAFPVQLKPEDWASGSKVWLLDVVAPSQKMASAVLSNFRQVVPKSADGKLMDDVRIHPIVARQVDPELLKKLGATADAAAPAGAAAR